MDTMRLTQLFWEYSLSEQELRDRLDRNDLNDPLTVSLYNRILLNTPDWYQVLSTLNPAQLKAALSNKVINTIPSQALRKRYGFASAILFPEE